jgi:hypothetical protein
LIILFASALLVAFAALVLTSQLPAPWWLWALDAVGLSVAVAVLAGLGLLLGRLRLPEGARALSLPLISAAVALATQGWLVAWLSPPAPVPHIDYWQIQLAAGSLAGAAFALLGGVAALSTTGPWYRTAAAAAAVAAGLYAAGPVLLRAGVPFDWRAFIGLAAMGLAAFVLVEAARRTRRA